MEPNSLLRQMRLALRHDTATLDLTVTTGDVAARLRAARRWRCVDLRAGLVQTARRADSVRLSSQG